MTFLTSIILVPLTTAKCLLSLLTFCLGLVNTMKTDRLQEKRGVGTSTFKNVRDLVMTVILSVIPLAGIVFHIGFLIMTSMIAVFSWSWTEESPQLHHFCFLLPFLPFESKKKNFAPTGTHEIHIQFHEIRLHSRNSVRVERKLLYLVIQVTGLEIKIVKTIFFCGLQMIYRKARD